MRTSLTSVETDDESSSHRREIAGESFGRAGRLAESLGGHDVWRRLLLLVTGWCIVVTSFGIVCCIIRLLFFHYPHCNHHHHHPPTPSPSPPNLGRHVRVFKSNPSNLVSTRSLPLSIWSLQNPRPGHCAGSSTGSGSAGVWSALLGL